MDVKLKAITKRYQAPDGSVTDVLDVPNFDIGAGEHVAMIGSSGSGKTTLLHVMAGITAPSSGSVECGVPGMSPVNLAKLPEAARDAFRGRYIGIIFQTHHLLGGFTAMENVLLGMSFTGRPADAGWARHLLETVGLKDRMDYRPGKLSVGQQQRVAVARALANRPQLVLADEPTGALDPINARSVLDLIRSLTTEVGAALLLVTHDREIAQSLARRVDLAEINRSSSRYVSADTARIAEVSR